MTTIDYEYLGKRYTGGGINSEGHRLLEFEEYYKLADVSQMPGFLAFLAPVGRIVHRFPPFRIKSSEVKRISDPLPDGSVTITIRVSCSTRFDLVETDRNGSPVTEATPPWLYRVDDFRIASVEQEESARCIWPGKAQVLAYDGIRWPGYDGINPLPLVNSAGEPLEVVASRGLSRIAFSYNLAQIDPNAVWKYNFKTNRNQSVICGMEFPARTVLIQSIVMEDKKEYNTDSSLRWNYYKVGIELLVDPTTFNKDYLNIGTHIRSDSGLERLWTWGQGRRFGALHEYFESGNSDGEEVTEPMFLNIEGTGISEFTTSSGQAGQVPVYFYGTPYEPIDFEFLELPKVK